MSEVVIGAAASHTTLMNTRWDEVDHLPEAHAFRDGLAALAQAIAEAEADLLVIVGSNHFRGMWLDLMPSLTIGVGEVIGAGEHGTPSGPQPVDPAAATALCNDLLAADFDLTFSAKIQVDHGITHAIQYLAPDGVPVVPVMINVFAPPLPSLARCLRLGELLGRAIADLPGDRRVAVIGTGGLSHRLPFPDWRAPESDDDEFLVDSWVNGRGNWERYEQRRRALIVSAPPDINPDFDRDFLARLERGQLAGLADELSAEALVDRAGNGGNEIRAWLTMAAACGHAPARTVAYAPVEPWLTGMAAAVIDQPRSPTASKG